MRLRNAFWLLVLALPAVGDEGLWLFNQFPKAAVQEKHEFAVTDPFLEKLRLASVQLGSGSGAFVSPHGLILTAHRVVAACAGQTDFYAATQSQETRCPGLEARVLVALEDVTREVKAGSTAAQVEKRCADRTGNVCTLVKLFGGERYDVYQYKKYTDVRLVFAPERGITFFGGNPSNLTFQRYGLDMAFVRAYESGKPAATPHFFPWSAEGPRDGELVFAVGSPGATARLATSAQLAFYRDSELRVRIARLQSRIADLREFAAKSPENQKAAALTLAALGNEYKLTAGKLIGLNDAWLMARKANFEKKLRQSVEHDPKLGTDASKIWDDVAAAYKTWTPNERAYQVLESRNEVAAAADDGVRAVLLARYLEELKALGDKVVPLKAILAASKDETRTLSQLLDEPARKLSKKRADTIGAVETTAAERIAQYRYRIFGAADYPDGTGTPRVTYGVVKGYKDRTEAPVPFTTTFGGLYFLAANHAEIYALPPRWSEGKSKLDMVTPFNFVSTCDITAGAAGSPVIDTKGEIVGVTFDGNLESIQLTYLYSDEAARAVHVATPGISAALAALYRTPALLKELNGGSD